MVKLLNLKVIFVQNVYGRICLYMIYYKRGDKMGAKYTEAQKRAAEKYKATRRDALNLNFPKGSKDRYKAHAERRGKSLTALIIELLEQDMQDFESHK